MIQATYLQTYTFFVYFIVLDASHFCSFTDLSIVSLSISSFSRRFSFLASVGLSVGVMIERTQIFQTGAIAKLVLVLHKQHILHFIYVLHVTTAIKIYEKQISDRK